MANQIPSFTSSASLVIKVDGVTLAYATQLSFSDDMTHAPVGGIGSYSFDANEPVQYAVRGAFTITHYSKAALDKTGSVLGAPSAPGRANSTSNTMLQSKYFSPHKLLLQKTFDVFVYERHNTDSASSITESFAIKDCRLTSYNMTFTPGSLVQESIGFMALSITDKVALSNAPAAPQQ